MSSPVYNALAAGKGGVPNQPVVKTVSAPAQPVKTTAPGGPKPGFNAKPDKSVNQGASPAMVGDKQKIQRPAAPQIAGTQPMARSAPSSGIESAMGAMADKLHPVRR